MPNNDAKEFEYIWKKLDDMESSHLKGMEKVSDSLNGFGVSLADLSKTVAQIGAHSHDPMLCGRMAMHEKEHEKGGNWLRNILVGLSILAILTASATIVLKAFI